MTLARLDDLEPLRIGVTGHRRLGHANIGITLDTYSHCLPVFSEEAACRVAALVVPA